MPRFKDSVLDALGVIQANQNIIINLLKSTATQESLMKADLSDVLKAVQEQNTVNKSVEALVDGFAAKLDAMAKGQTTVDPADLTALALEIRANNTELQAKVTANTPAVDPAPPAPPAGV